MVYVVPEEVLRVVHLAMGSRGVFAVLMETEEIPQVLQMGLTVL